jgi:hypothetical protein
MRIALLALALLTGCGGVDGMDDGMATAAPLISPNPARVRIGDTEETATAVAGRWCVRSWQGDFKTLTYFTPGCGLMGTPDPGPTLSHEWVFSIRDGVVVEICDADYTFEAPSCGAKFSR